MAIYEKRGAPNGAATSHSQSWFGHEMLSQFGRNNGCFSSSWRPNVTGPHGLSLLLLSKFRDIVRVVFSVVSFSNHRPCLVRRLVSWVTLWLFQTSISTGPCDLLLLRLRILLALHHLLFRCPITDRVCRTSRLSRADALHLRTASSGKRPQALFVYR